MAERARFAIALRPSEIAGALPAADGAAPPAPLAEIESALRQLKDWGNLDDTPDTAEAAAIEEFYRHTPALSAYDHFATMAFAQLTCRESLRDLGLRLNARRPASLCQSARRRPARSRVPRRDRGALDFARLHRLHALSAFSVTRLETNTRYHVVESRPVARGSGLRCDQTIRLNSAKGRLCHPEPLRRVSYIDPETDLWLIFPTNQFTPDALNVAPIYKHRWKIERLFRWIKQRLRLRGFFSAHPNGVRAQIWTALCAHLLVAIAMRPGGGVCSPRSLERGPVEARPTCELLENCRNRPSP